MNKKAKLYNEIYEQKKNNASSVIFADLCTKYGWTRLKGRRCAIKVGDDIVGFSVSSNGTAECRQYYDDYAGLITYSVKKGKVFMFDHSDLNLDPNHNRIAANGTKARTAKVPFAEGLVLN